MEISTRAFPAEQLPWPPADEQTFAQNACEQYYGVAEPFILRGEAPTDPRVGVVVFGKKVELGDGSAAYNEAVDSEDDMGVFMHTDDGRVVLQRNRRIGRLIEDGVTTIDEMGRRNIIELGDMNGNVPFLSNLERHGDRTVISADIHPIWRDLPVEKMVDKGEKSTWMPRHLPTLHQCFEDAAEHRTGEVVPALIPTTDTNGSTEDRLLLHVDLDATKPPIQDLEWLQSNEKIKEVLTSEEGRAALAKLDRAYINSMCEASSTIHDREDRREVAILGVKIAIATVISILSSGAINSDSGYDFSGDYSTDYSGGADYSDAGSYDASGDYGAQADSSYDDSGQLQPQEISFGSDEVKFQDPGQSDTTINAPYTDANGNVYKTRQDWVDGRNPYQVSGSSASK